MSKFILVLDIGSTNLKSTIFKVDSNRCECASVSQADGHNRYFGKKAVELVSTTRAPTPVLHQEVVYEIDPDELVTQIRLLIENNLTSSGMVWKDIECIGITSQRNTFITWNATTDKPYHNFISWKDRRSASIADTWNSSLLSRATRCLGFIIQAFYRWHRAVIMSALVFRTGHVMPRLKWLENNLEKFSFNLRKRDTRLGLVDTYLLWKFSKGQAFATDVSSLSSTGIFNTATLRFSRPLVWFFGIPRAVLPAVRDSAGFFGRFSLSNSEPERSITAMVADQQAAVFAHGLTEVGQFKLTLGTGAFLDVRINGQIHFDNRRNIYTLVGWKFPREKSVNVLEAQVEEYADIVAWCHENDVSLYVDSEVPDQSSCVFCESPFSFTSNSEKLSLTKEEKTFAVLAVLAQKIISRVAHLSRVIELRHPMRVDGGLSVSDLLMRMLASLLNEKVLRSRTVEMTSYGAALLAAHGAELVDKNDFEYIKSTFDYDTFAPENHLRNVLILRNQIDS